MSQKKKRRIRDLEKQTVAPLKEVAVVKKVLGIREIIKENWKFLMVIIVGVILVYFNGMNADFVSDDYAAITQNPGITNFWVTMGFKSVPGICNYILAVLFGVKSPMPFHLLSLSLYIVVCLLAFIFVYLLYNRKLAIFTLLLFAFHPVHVEAVTWISGRPYLLTTLFVLAALIGTIMYLNTKKYTYILVMAVSLVLMFFTDKIRGFSYFLILGLISVVFNERFKLLSDWKKYMKFLILPIIVVAIFAYPMAIKRIGDVNSGYNTSESIFYNPFFQYPTAITKYLQLLVLPLDLTLYHTMYIIPEWINWAVILTFIGSLGYFYFKNKNLFFWLALIFLASAPSMLPVKVSWLVAERYVFFGSLGFCAFLSIILIKIWEKSKVVAVGLLGLILGMYGVRTYLRNIDWQTNHNLWVRTCQVSPNSHNAWNNIGDDYDKLKQYDNAVKGFTQSTVVKPNYADAYHNRANIFFKTGRLDLARDSYNTALSYSPGLYQTYLSLVQIDLTENRLDLALDHSQKALQIQQNNPQAWYVFGVVLLNSGNQDKAKEAFKNALVLVPDFQPAKDALIMLMSKT